LAESLVVRDDGVLVGTGDAAALLAARSEETAFRVVVLFPAKDGRRIRLRRG
jgi:archaeosine-15-forming tRNA-guanine transglycosylase